MRPRTPIAGRGPAGRDRYSGGFIDQTPKGAVYILYFVVLGAFWGLSPSIYKVLGPDMPATHIIFITGLGVGAGLWLFGRRRQATMRGGRRLTLYGLGCGTLLNIPFAMQIVFASRVPAAVLAIVFATSPFFNYGVAVMLRQERLTSRRVLALIAGLAAGVLLVATRENDLSSGIDGWTLASFLCPLLYTAYNWFTSSAWPKGVTIHQAGMAESFASALVVLPFLLVLAGTGRETAPGIGDYWPVGILIVMWIAERIVYYTLIRDKGPVYTVQAIYIAAPAGVVYGILFFDERPDLWLCLSLALVMVALWLNNTGETPSTDTMVEASPVRP